MGMYLAIAGGLSYDTDVERVGSSHKTWQSPRNHASNMLPTL